MAFLKDSINVKVFLLVVMAVVAMVSLVLVFKTNFEDINLEYTKKVGELNTTFEALKGTQSVLNKTAEELEIRSLREEDLKDKYGELKEERDELVKEKTKLLDEVEDKIDQINTLNIQIKVKENEISDLKDDVASLKNKLNCYQSGQTNC